MILTSTINYWINLIFLYLYSFTLRRSSPPLIKIGSKLGGWFVPTHKLNHKSICYCAGAGEDISFDLGLIKKFDCQVFCFDPTPRAIAHVKQKANKIKKLVFLPIGLWNKNATLKFYAPTNPAHVSHSVTNLQQTKKFFWGKCQRLSTIMKSLKHKHIDLLKIDIEGAEYTVLNDMLNNSIHPSILCVEFDQPAPVQKTMMMLKKMSDHGYDLIKQDHFNFTFNHYD